MRYKNGTGTQAKESAELILLVLLACALTACTQSMSMEEAAAGDHGRRHGPG